MRNMLPDALAELQHGRAPSPDTEFVAEAQREADRLTLRLVRDCDLPGVPSVGDEVWANPNWEPVPVTRVEWNLDPGPDEYLVTVYLADLDEDEVGAEWGATELLMESGWRPDLDI